MDGSGDGARGKQVQKTGKSKLLRHQPNLDMSHASMSMSRSSSDASIARKAKKFFHQGSADQLKEDGHQLVKQDGHQTNTIRDGHQTNTIRDGHQTNTIRDGHQTTAIRDGHQMTSPVSINGSLQIWPPESKHRHSDCPGGPDQTKFTTSEHTTAKIADHRKTTATELNKSISAHHKSTSEQQKSTSSGPQKSTAVEYKKSTSLETSKSTTFLHQKTKTLKHQKATILEQQQKFTRLESRKRRSWTPCLPEQISTGDSQSENSSHATKRSSKDPRLSIKSLDGFLAQGSHSLDDSRSGCHYQMMVHLKQGHDLAAKDSNGTSDPYVKFLLNNKLVYKSKTISKNLNPVWDEHFVIAAQDTSLPLEIKVYDYDWGRRDDFLGQTSIDMNSFKENTTTDIVLTLSIPGKSDYLGQISLSLSLIPTDPDEHLPSPEVSTDQPGTIRKVKSGAWSSVVNIILVEGRDLLAMDCEGASDPYCKFRLGNERYRTKTVYSSLSPRWLEQWDMYLYQDHFLDITVWDKDQRTKDDFMGRATADLSQLERENSHKLWINLEDGAGRLLLIITISGSTCPTDPSFLANFSQSDHATSLLRSTYSLNNTFSTLEDVAHLLVKVFRAKGLVSADLGGKSDPYAVLELDNTRVQTHTEYKTVDPDWNKVFSLAVRDIHSVLYVTVYDEDKNHKSEFLGKIAVPLLRMEPGGKLWYGLKDKKLRRRAKGSNPQILLEFDLEWNPVRAAVRTFRKKEELYMKVPEKFKRHVFINNFQRVKTVVMDVIEFHHFVKSCLEWESTPRSVVAFIVFITVVYNFELYMAPFGLLLIFVKNFIVISFIEPRPAEREEAIYMSDDEDDNDDKGSEKEERKSLKERLQAIQDVTTLVQNALGEVASRVESVKNTFNFSVPFLSWLAIFILSTLTVVLYFVPLRLLVMAWGVKKFTKRLIRPGAVPNNEILDFLSRVPDDEQIISYRAMNVNSEPSPHSNRFASKRKPKQV